MTLEEALARRAPPEDPFALRTATDGRLRLVPLDGLLGHGRSLYRWCWDGRCLSLEVVPQVPAAVDWVPGHLPPPVEE
jgi:hypothetical protein